MSWLFTCENIHNQFKLPEDHIKITKLTQANNYSHPNNTANINKKGQIQYANNNVHPVLSMIDTQFQIWVHLPLLIC